MSEWLSGHFAVGEEYDIHCIFRSARQASPRKSKQGKPIPTIQGKNELQLISYTKIYALKL